MKRVLQIIGFNILFAVLFLLLIGVLLFISELGYRVSSLCSSLSDDACMIEGRIVDYVDRSYGKSRKADYKIEYRNKSGNKEFFCVRDGFFFSGKKIGDTVIFKVNGDKILLASPDDVVILLAFCAFSAIIFLIFCALGLFSICNSENEKFDGTGKATLLIFRVLMLCGAVDFSLFSLQRLKEEFFPEKIETALILSVDILKPEPGGTEGQLITVKDSIEGRKITIIKQFSNSNAIVSTGQEVDIVLSEKNSPRIAGNWADKMFVVLRFVCSLFSILFTILAFFRKVKTDKEHNEEKVLESVEPLLLANSFNNYRQDLSVEFSKIREK